MVAVRIPGAESIDPVAPTRDPGVQATPDEFGAQIGTGLQHFGDAAVAVGAHLYQKQQDASDQVFQNAYSVNMAPAAQEAIYRNRQQYPNGGPDAIQALNQDLYSQHDQVVQALKDRGINPSDKGLLAAKTHFAGIQQSALVQGVTYGHNQQITSLQTTQNDTIDLAKAQVLSGAMTIEQGLAAVDSTVKSSKGLFSGTQLVDVEDKWKQGVIDAAIESKTKSGDLVGAKALRDKYYGSTPKFGQNIYSAIYGQESGSGANTSTSVTGARGGMQIQPATFAQYAKPGENIDNPADNQTVGRRIIDDLSAKSGGDPARIAVGYFSGPGNIAPPGSPTPWKRDIADPTGKTVSSYVSDVMKRMGGQASVKVASADGGAGMPNANASGDTSVASSGDSAPVLPNATKALYWDQQFKAAAVDQKQADAQQKALIQQQSDNRELEVMKDIHSDSPTIPAREIWNDPKLTLAAKEKLFTIKQTATGDGRTDKTYGPGFYDAYRKVHAADNDPNKITDPTSLYARVGPNGDLTVAGVDKLVTEIQARRSPEGVAEGEMKKQFLATAKAQISGSDEGLHIKDPKGDELYLKFMAQALPAYDAGRKAGKSATQLLNPDSPDYIGKSIATFKRPADQWFADTIGGSPVHQGAAVPPFDIKTVKSLDDLVGAYRAGKISKAQADDLAISKGWAVRRTPNIVPVSQ